MKIFFKNVAKSALVAFILFSAANAANAQVVKGRVLDSASGDPLIGVTVLVDGTRNFAITDVNGNYTLKNVPVGKQKILFKMMGYAGSVAELNVKSRSNSLNVTMSYQLAKQVVVKAKRINNTEAALLSKRKKAAVSQDAISSEQISKSPDSDAADAAKRVTGVTIVDGKYVYIRGLGERYCAVMMGNSVIPSPDPDKRVVPLDIFPVGLLDNLVMIKSYSPDMPGEFAGGIVQINPKDYPEEEILKVSIGTGYHSSTTFKDFYTYDGGDFDMLGIDDGSRKVKDNPQNSKDFENIYTPKKEKGKLPGKVSFLYGNSYDIGEGGKFGIIVSGLFSESSKTKEKIYKKYGYKNSDFSLIKDFSTKESVYSTSKGLLLSLAYTSINHKIRSTSFFTHKSNDKASKTDGYNDDGSENDEIRYQLSFATQSLFFTQLQGDHQLGVINNLVFKWDAAYARSSRYEPDTRETKYTRGALTTDPYDIRSLKDGVYHNSSDHVDNLYYVSPSIVIPFTQWSGLKSKLTLGSAYTYRDREANSHFYVFDATAPDYEVVIPIEDWLDDNNPPIQDNTQESDSFEGSLMIVAGYAMVDMPLFPKFRMLGGVRYEYADMDIISYDPTTSSRGELPYEVVEKNNVMPCVNFTYAATNNTNLRLSGSMTVIRPDFREATSFRYTNIANDEEWKGNPELKQSDIYNADFRYEWFPSTSEIVALSLFYKYIDSPIENAQQYRAGGDLYASINANYAHNMGAELELKKSLGFIARAIEDFTFSLNFSYIYSNVDIDETITFGSDEITITNNNRPLVGQSPYVINTGLIYDNADAGFTGNILFNMTGPTIKSVGTSVTSNLERGDLYQESVPRLDVVLKQRVFEKGAVKLSAKNLLDPNIEEKQEYKYKTTGQKETKVVRSYREGISLSLSYSQSF